MLIKFVPNCAQGENKTYDGMAEFKLMTVDEKYSIAGVLQELNEEEGPIKALLKSLDLIQPFIHSCVFKNIESGEEFGDFVSLRSDCRNDELCQELASFIMNGYKVSKNLKA